MTDSACLVSTHEREVTEHTAAELPFNLNVEISNSPTPMSTTPGSRTDSLIHPQVTTSRVDWHEELPLHGSPGVLRPISTAEVSEQIVHGHDWRTDTLSTCSEHNASGPTVANAIDDTKAPADAYTRTVAGTPNDAFILIGVHALANTDVPVVADVPEVIDTHAVANAPADMDAPAVVKGGAHVEASTNAKVPASADASTEKNVLSTVDVYIDETAATEAEAPTNDTKISTEPDNPGNTDTNTRLSADAKCPADTMASTDTMIATQTHVITAPKIAPSGKPLTGAKINTDIAAEPWRTYMEDLKNIPCIDCGELDRHTVDCNHGSRYLHGL